MISVTVGGASALALVVKVTLLLGIAGMAATAMRRASAASRHLIWLLALGSAVALAGLIVFRRTSSKLAGRAGNSSR